MYTKLYNLVNDTFTIETIDGFTWKKWDNDQKKMLTADSYADVYRKIYEVVTDKGTLDLGQGQVGSLLESVLYFGTANLLGQTFKVKSNGKTGVDIRYYFNPTTPAVKRVVEIDEDTKDEYNRSDDSEIDVDSIPF